MRESFIKLTTHEMKTRTPLENSVALHYTQWELGKTLIKPENIMKSRRLCTNTVYHVYPPSMELALCCNCIHAFFNYPRIFKAEGVREVSSILKIGVSELTLIEEIPAIPVINPIYLFTLFCFYCVKELYGNDDPFFFKKLECVALNRHEYYSESLDSFYNYGKRFHPLVSAATYQIISMNTSITDISLEESFKIFPNPLQKFIDIATHSYKQAVEMTKIKEIQLVRRRKHE